MTAKLNVLALPFFVFTFIAHADECSCDVTDTAQSTLVETNSLNGRAMKLRFEANPITTRTKVAFLCTPDSQTLTLAKPWMVEHGHGSMPSKLVPVSETCTRLEKISFFMDGSWQMRTSFSDADAANFDFEVVKSN